MVVDDDKALLDNEVSKLDVEAKMFELSLAPRTLDALSMLTR